MHVDLPKRQSVVEQVADYIRNKITAGHWEEKLPPLRALHSQLQVSRNTLHRALIQLEHEGIVERKDRSRTLVCQPVSVLSGVAREIKVGWLDDASLSNISSMRLREILQFQVNLIDRGMGFELFVNQSIRERYSPNRLKLWMGERKVTIWVLANVSAEVQRFFAKSGAPCIILGTRVPELELPSVDLCARATCRHAVGKLAKLGHRRIGLLIPARSSYDDEEREQGFEEGVADFANRMTGVIVRHNGTTTGIAACLDRILPGKSAGVTGLIASRAMEGLSAMSHFGCARGIRVPGDVSVISLESDACFSNMIPSVSYYDFERSAVIRKLFRMVSHQDPVASDIDLALVPKFYSGGTLSTAPKLAGE